MLFNEKDLQLRDFAVNKDFGDQESFFRIITDGGEVQLSKLKFQLNQPLPDTISCRIKGFNGNLPVLGHNMPRYVSDFYADGFQRGEEFDFKVIALPDDTNGSYRLTDDNGLIFKLHEPKATLIKGQTVKCKFDSMSQSFFSLRRSNTDDLYPMLSLGDIARIAALHGVGAARMESQLQKIEGLEKALEELNHGRSVWVITAIRDIRRIMPSLFRTAMTNVNYDTVYDIIRAYERVLLYLLQGSGYLRHLKGKERSNIQEEITEQLELLDILKRTHRIVSNNEQHKFINNLLDNLKESGYIYHPTTQFSIMMILFRMSPELVNTSLGNIFDTLMGWDLEIWKTEPFRQAFVEQLEIYIKETREEIDLFLEAETASDNEKIEKVLTAIAIQKSLATETDKMDMRINTSLFYRYLSLLRTAKADVLLEKSYLALMGVNLPTDYTWSDIKEPTMMMTRAAVDPPANTKLPSMSSYYMKDDIEIEINQEGITISKTNEDPINQIYNGMLPWPGNGLKVKTELSRPFKSAKMKSMEGHAEFWNDIENSLFLKDEDSSEQIATRRMPDIDDTVRIIIDRVIPSANDFNKIEAFECKIVDDHFIEARGILPAENIVNYNLHGVTVGTFRHDNGAHMKFDAQVVDIDDNDTLIFSLAETAHHAIRDIANTGEQCYCVITKDNGRSYSAISDKGFGLYVNKEMTARLHSIAAIF